MMLVVSRPETMPEKLNGVLELVDEELDELPPNKPLRALVSELTDMLRRRLPSKYRQPGRGALGPCGYLGEAMSTQKAPPGPTWRRFELKNEGAYWSSLRTACGAWLAWDRMDVPACCRILVLVKFTISAAMSTSVIWLCDDCVFCSATWRFEMVSSRRFWAAPRVPRTPEMSWRAC